MFVQKINDMNQKINKISLVLLLISSQLFSQEKWTLNDCVSYAVGHNLQLNDFKYNSQSNKETRNQSVRSLLPTINATGDYNVRFGRSVDPNNNEIVNTDFFSNNYTLEFRMDLFKGFQNINTIKLSKLLYNANKQETLQQKYLLAFRVMSAFYDILFYEGLTEISIEQQSLSQANYDLVNRQIELGIKAGADLYEAESRLLADKLKVTQSKNQLNAAKLKLIQEMNLENALDISIISEESSWVNELDISNEKSDSIFSKAMTFMPIIEAKELRVKAAKKQVAVSRGGLFPTLSLYGGYGTGYFQTLTNANGETIPFKDQFRDNTFKFIGISLNIPITNGWSSHSKIKQQKITLLREENNLELQEQELFKTINELVLKYKSLIVEYEQSNQKVKAQLLSFETAQKKHEKGLISSLELYTSKNLLGNAQNENLQVKLLLEVNKKTLDFYKGLPIFNINN